jgi:rfaE bifunctional protein nucleotidyltransferase chain/domain
MLNISHPEIYTSPKIISITEAANLVIALKKSGKKTGLCHGGFDLLHPGHIKHFESAKKICDVLMVSVTSDQYVSLRKGDGRPVFTDKLRAYMIAQIGCVDYVVISDFKRAVEIISLIRPDYYIKGPDEEFKQTPGITAEKAAIAGVDGEMYFTHDPKCSASEIIEYIRSIDQKQLLLVLDRDGTLIPDIKFLGTDPGYEKSLVLIPDVVNFILYLQKKYKTTKIVATNQSGVARGFFSEALVRDVNRKIDALLKDRKVYIDSWQFCPDMDRGFVENNPGVRVRKKYLREHTKRKPSADMAYDGLAQTGKNMTDFDIKLVLGDREMEDGGMARNLGAIFINVKNKNYEEMIFIFEKSAGSTRG